MAVYHNWLWLIQIITTNRNYLRYFIYEIKAARFSVIPSIVMVWMRNVPNKIRHLNTWSPVGVLCRAVMEENITVCGFWELVPSPTFHWLFRLSLRMRMWSLGSLLLQPDCLWPCLLYMMDSKSSGTISENQLFYKLLLVILLYYNNRKVTNTPTLWSLINIELRSRNNHEERIQQLKKLLKCTLIL